MKTINQIFTLLFLVFCIAMNGYSQDTKPEIYKQGVEAYTAGDYSFAVEKWIGIYNTGYHSANLEYNLGNAYFKLNDIPNAILFYERARLLSPADEDIIYNLQIARTLVVDRFEEIPELFFVRWFNLVSLVFSSNSWATISIVAFFIFLLSLSLYLYSSGYKNKVLGFWLGILFFVLSAASFSFASRNKTLVHDSNKAIIFNPLVNGKSSPDNSGNDLFVLHEGTKVTVGDKVGDWYEIRLSDGNKGWVPANSLKII
jgi:hypothetical protein